MKKIFVILFLFSLNIFSQNIPQSFYLSDENKLYKSQDKTPVSNSINDILIVGDTIWLGTSRGLSRSIDKGENWKNYYNSPEFGTESISALGYYEGIIFVATAHSIDQSGQSLPEGSGIKFSFDNGETWSSIPQPLDNNSDTTVQYGINTLRALPVTTAIQNLIYDIAFTENTIWITTFAGGLRKNKIDSLIINPERKWARVVLPPDKLDEILPTDTLNFALQPVAGNFGPESNLNHRVFSVVSVNDSLIIVGTANGVNRGTLLEGKTDSIMWKKFNHQNQNFSISGNFVTALGYDNYTNTIWAASWRAEDAQEFNAVSYSTDLGEKWNTTLINEQAHNFGIKSGKVIVATDNGPYLSFNNPDNWILPINIIDAQTKIELRTIVFYSAGFEDDGKTAWLGSDEGLIKNTNVTSSYSNNWKIFFASQPLQNKEDTYAYPNPYSPKLDKLKIKYSTGGKQSKVTIRIYNFSMNYVRTIVQNADRGNPTFEVNSGENNGVIDYWDGRDDAGNIVPNGVYFYRIEVDSNEPIYGKILVLQ